MCKNKPISKVKKSHKTFPNIKNTQSDKEKSNHPIEK